MYMPGKVFEITNKEEFGRFIEENRFFVVKFTAGWCGPCRRAEPIINREFLKMPDDVHLVYVDVDKGSTIASKFRVKTIPTFINIIDKNAYEIYPSSKENDIVSFFNITKQRVADAKRQ